MKGNKSKLKENMLMLALLTVAGSLIYALPYFRSYYYDAYLNTYNLTNSQMGTLGAMFGIFGMVSYLFGGVVADIVPPKKLLGYSLILTGAAGILHLFVSSYKMLLVIYLTWGFTSLFAFWPALVKGIRGLADSKDQSKAFGFMEAGRGIVNAIHLAVALTVFNYFSKKVNEAMGINGILVLYSVIVIILGLLILIFLKDSKSEKSDAPMNFNQVMTILKMPQVWILSFILCATYTINMSYMYFTPYATANFGVTATTAAMLSIMADYIRPFSSSGGGIMADKVGRSRVMFLGFILLAISVLLVALMPNINVVMLFIICGISYFAMYSNYALIFSFMEEGDIPMEYSGTATGVICTIGYLPEAICPLIFGRVIDSYGNIGYKYYFIGIAVIFIIGAAMMVVWNNHIKNKKQVVKQI